MDLIRYLFTVFMIETALKLAECEIHKRAATCPRFTGFTGKVKYRRGGNRANFKCLRGAKRYGPRRLDCRADGTWSGDIPLCLKSGCVPVDISQSPFLDMTEQQSGALLKFTCEAGYQLDGAAESTCDGTNWSDPLPKCIATFDVTRCDFEQSLCGWAQDDTDEGEWAQHAGSTQTGNTGPKFDHTHALDATGHYMFFEASTPTQEGDQARLFSPEYAPDMSPICFGFWYHMLGPDDSGHVGSLEVFILGESQFVEDLNASFYIDGNQGDSWNEGEVVIPPMNEPFQIVIEATRKLSYISDIAIDDVGLHNCSHDEMASITTTPTPAPTTTIATTIKTTQPAAATTTKVSPKLTTTTSNPTTTTVTSSLATAGRTTTQVLTNAPTTRTKATTIQSTKLSTLPSTTKQTTVATTTQPVTTKKTTIPPTTTTPIATTTTPAATTTTVTSTTAKPTTTTAAATTTTTLATTTTATLPPTTQKQTTTTRTKRTPKPTKATKPTPKPTKRTTKMTTTPARTTTKTTTVPATTKTALASTASNDQTTQTSQTVSPSSGKGSRSSTSAPASVSATGMISDGTGSVTSNVTATSPAQQATDKAGQTTDTSKTQTSKTTVAVSKVKSHPDDDTLKPLMIGLGVGIVAGLIVIGVIAYVCVRRRKFYTSRYEDELKPITKTGSSNSLNNDQYYPDEEYQS